jgi:exonuclease VII large subunit
MKKIIIPLKIVGSLAIILATLVFTIMLSNTEGELSEINGKILSHKNNSLMAMQLLSSINERFMQRRLDLFERNNLLINDVDSPIILELDTKILDTTKKITRTWEGSIKDKKDSEKDLKALNKEMNKIIVNPEDSFEKKLEKLDEIRENVAKSFKERNKKYQNKLKDYRKREQALKNKKSLWNGLFVCLQAIGLILLAVSEILILCCENKNITRQSSER